MGDCTTMPSEYRIRDPVHNYIYLTNVEERIINHSLFQRLRFISQNGLVYYTYPSNRTCRFVHSLGVMQIAGNLFLNSLNNSTSDDKKNFVSSALELIDYVAKQIGGNTSIIATIVSENEDETLNRYGLFFNYNQEQEKELSPDKKETLAKLVLFQSVRLAAVLHDLGHLPLSHLMENSIKDYLLFNLCNEEVEREDNEVYKSVTGVEAKLAESKSKSKIGELHELIGLKLLEIVLPSQENQYHTLCRRIAEYILNKGNQIHKEVIDPLRTLIEGELDADRLDYVLRDPNSSGLELGAYDLERLQEDFTLINQSGQYLFLPKVQALSAIESFFHQRYLVYKYLIYHHSKVRFDVLASEITVILLNIYHGKTDNKEICAIKDELKKNNFHYLWNFVSKPELFYNCNDNWYINLIHNIYTAINTCSLPQEQKPYELSRLKLLLVAFVLRKTENMISLFKRYNEYDEFVREIQDKVNELHNVKFNKQLYFVIKNIFGVENYRYKFDIIKRNIFYDYDIIVMMQRTAPKLINIDKSGKSELEVIIGTNGKKKESATEYSPYLSLLGKLSSEDQNFHVFLVGREIRKNQDAIKIIKSKLIDFFVECYKEV